MGFTRKGVFDDYGAEEGEDFDVMALASAAADSCRLLQLLCLRATGDCMQDFVRRDSGHGGLAALSSLTHLSCLRLVNTGIGEWPPELSRLSKLQRLTAVDCFDDPLFVDEDGDDLPWPVPHNLQALPHLQQLRSTVFSWEHPLPSSLTQLALDSRSWPTSWEQSEQLQPLLQQLPRLPLLAELVLAGDAWATLQGQRLAAALRRCVRLTALQLMDIDGCIAVLLPPLAGLSQLQSLAVSDPRAIGMSSDSILAGQLSQLTACRRLHWQQKELASATELAPVFAAMPALELLTLAGTSDSSNDVLEEQINGRRSRMLPSVRLVGHAVVPLSCCSADEVPFAECNAVLGQQLDKLVK